MNTGKLRCVPEAAKLETGLPLKDLTVLATYRLDKIAGHRDGACEQFERALTAVACNQHQSSSLF